MKAPLSERVRRLLNNRKQSQQLMSAVIVGGRNEQDAQLTVNNQQFQVVRVASVSRNGRSEK